MPEKENPKFPETIFLCVANEDEDEMPEAPGIGSYWSLHVDECISNPGEQKPIGRYKLQKTFLAVNETHTEEIP